MNKNKLKDFGTPRKFQDTLFLRTNMPGIYRLKFKFVSEEWLKRISGGATDKGCIINNKTVCLNEELDVVSASAVALHELLHFILNTAYRSDVVGAYDKSRKMLFNIASDIQINDMVIKFGKFTRDEGDWFTSNQDGLIDHVIGKCGKPKEDILKMSTEKIYSLLLQGTDTNGDENQQGEKGEGSEMDDPFGEDGEGDGSGEGENGEPQEDPFGNANDNGELTEEQKQEIKKAFEEVSDEVKEMNRKFGNGVVDLTSEEDRQKQRKKEKEQGNIPQDFLKDMVEFKEQMVKKIGNISGNWQREFDISAGVKIPWEKIISREVRGILRGYDDLSFKKINVVASLAIKRHSGKRVILPSYIEKKPGRLGVIIDTSASISQDNLNKFLTIVNNYLKHFRNVDARVISIDTKIQTDQLVKKVENIKVAGGGGTDLNCGIKLLDEDKTITNMLIFTDGYCDFNEYKVKATKATFILDGVTKEEVSDYLPKYGRKIFIR